MTGNTDGDPAVVLFDGVCNLCTWGVRFVIERDPDAEFRFAPLQSTVGERLLASCADPPTGMETWVLIEDGECYTKSTAALRVARRLGGPYRGLVPFRHLPTRIRDGIYDLIARHRYELFGRKESCMVPTPDVRARFLDDEDLP